MLPQTAATDAEVSFTALHTMSQLDPLMRWNQVANT